MGITLEERAEERKAVGQRPLRVLWSHSRKDTRAAGTVSCAARLSES